MAGIEAWLLQYGLYAIFLLLALGIIGLPIPDETLIVIAGVLVSQEKLPLIPTLIAVYSGGLVGITLSYLIGYTGGRYLVTNYGLYIRLDTKKINTAEKWFKDVGKWVLFFGYFVIGLRHLAGFVAGIMKLHYKQFALFAYPGLFVWASAVFTIGYAFSKSWESKLSSLTFVMIIVAILALLVIYSYLIYKKRKIL